MMSGDSPHGCQLEFESVFDADDLPVVGVRAPENRVTSAASKQPSFWLLAGNERIKLYCDARGRVFPLLLGEHVQAYCGIPGPQEAFGGSRLVVSEAGMLKPVVGPEDAWADHSDVVTAAIRFSPGYVERRFDLGQVRVRYRIAVPMTGIPAVVCTAVARNRDAGAAGVRRLP